MALKIDGDEVKSIKALVVSLNGLVDSIKTLSDEQILGAVRGAKDTADAALAIATENKKAVRLMTKLNILVNWLKKKI